jgi:hypothetical protein
MCSLILWSASCTLATLWSVTRCRKSMLAEACEKVFLFSLMIGDELAQVKSMTTSVSSSGFTCWSLRLACISSRSAVAHKCVPSTHLRRVVFTGVVPYDAVPVKPSKLVVKLSLLEIYLLRGHWMRAVASWRRYGGSINYMTGLRLYLPINIFGRRRGIIWRATTHRRYL